MGALADPLFVKSCQRKLSKMVRERGNVSESESSDDGSRSEDDSSSSEHDDIEANSD